VACAILNDSASDPYRQESNGEKKMGTYFNPGTMELVFMSQLVLVSLALHLVLMLSSKFWHLNFEVNTSAYNTNISINTFYIICTNDFTFITALNLHSAYFHRSEYFGVQNTFPKSRSTFSKRREIDF
jgi:hypothetical protein